MLKKMMIVVAAAILAAGFSACSHVDTATTLNGVRLAEGESTTVAHMNAGVWGIYFFNALPLFTGSTSHPGSCAIFRDTVQLDNAVNMITRKAKSLDATKLVNLQSDETSFTLPLFLSYKSIQLSGTAVK